MPQEKVQDVRIDFEEGSDKFSQYTDQATLQYGGFSIGESVIDDSYQETYISLSSAFLTLTPE